MIGKNKITPTKDMLKEWADDTDNNRHSDVLIKIANWAALHKPEGCYRRIPFETLEEAFRKIAWMIDEGLGYSNIMNYRYDLTKDLEEAIGDVYGEDVRQMIHDCL